MATNRQFQAMLNEVLSEKLLTDELIPRDFILKNIQKDNTWKGGKYIVPFKGAQASSIRMGGLTASNDVSDYKYVRGSVDDYKEAWGTLQFHHRDIMEHNGKVNEDSFLKIFPDQVEQFMEHMKMIVSAQLGTGPHLAIVTDDTNAATGVLVIDKIDKMELGQKLTLKDNNSVALSVYVIAINLNTSAVTVSLTRGGAAADVSAYSVAQVAKLYTDGADAVSFQSICDALLSAANGGSATLHGQSKIAYPYLQAINVSGAAITAGNILEKLFDAFNQVRQKARGGKADTFLMSYQKLGAVLKAVESKSNGAANWKIEVKEKNASIYGWDEVLITTVKGTLKVVGIQEWADDKIAILDMSAMKFATNGFFQTRKNPDGDEYFEVRGEDGFKYLVDICLFGELIVTAPGKCGIIHSIPAI